MGYWDNGLIRLVRFLVIISLQSGYSMVTVWLQCWLQCWLQYGYSMVTVLVTVLVTGWVNGLMGLS